MSDTLRNKFAEKVQKNFLELLMPYGFILLSAPATDKMNREQLETFNKSVEIMDSAKEIHRSLTEENLDSEHIELHNNFENPIDVIISVYKEVQKDTNKYKSDMAEVLQYMHKNPQLLKMCRLDPVVQAEKKMRLAEQAKDKKPTLHEKLNNAKEKVREADAAKPDKGDKSKTKRDERE